MGCSIKQTVLIVSAVLFLCLVLSSQVAAQTPRIMWYYDLDAPSFGSAATGDIDGDGKLEIAFGTYFNDEHVYALNGEDGSLLWKFDTGGCNDASPIIADVDLDGELEVVVPASSPCKVFCLKGIDGSVEWVVNTGYCLDSPPAVADMDLDGKPEIVLGTFHGHVFCLNGEDGSTEWDMDLGYNSYIQAGPNLLDLNGDGQLDVVVAQWAGDNRVYALDGADGSELWHSDLPTDYMYHGCSFADIDEDGKNELAIGCYDSKVYVFNGEDGSLAWDYTAPYYVGAPTVIADLNNDHHLEIVIAAYNKIRALTHTGTQLWNYNAGGGNFRGVALSDLDSNGILDVAFGSDDGKLTALHGNNGQLLWAVNLKAHYGKDFELDHAPIIADFDDDGKLDIFIVGGHANSSTPANNHGRAYAVSGVDATGPGWPMFRHDDRHSACFDGYLTLECDASTISAGTGGTIVFSVKAGIVNGGRNYFLLGSASGTEPGLPLPGGMVTLPLNWDALTDLVIAMANAPALLNFHGTLDLSGKSLAHLDTQGPLPPTMVGAMLHFAYLLYYYPAYHPYDFVSNAVTVEIGV